MNVVAADVVDGGRQAVEASLRLARAFASGRRLAVAAPGRPDHAHHVAVEFVHPVIAGARALPAMAVASVELAPPGDVVMVIGSHPGRAEIVLDGSLSDAELVRTYHVLWELVQICLDHPGISGGRAGAGGDSTEFLYPFLDAAELDEDGLRADLTSSAASKRATSLAVCADAIERNAATLAQTGAAIRDAIATGGRVLSIGNGGSATDATRFTRLLADAGVPAHSLADDYAVLTALANDIGADQIFARQLDALLQPSDVLFAWSTSGASRNLVTAWERARRAGAICFGSCGYGGTAMTDLDALDAVLTVESSSVHRIQEAQAELMSVLVHEIARAT